MSSAGDQQKRRDLLQEDAPLTLLVGAALLLTAASAIALGFGFATSDERLLKLGLVVAAVDAAALGLAELRQRHLAARGPGRTMRRGPHVAGPHVVGRILHEIRPYYLRITGLLSLNLFATPLVLLTPIPLKLAVDSVVGTDPVPGFIDAIVPDFLTSSPERILLFAALLQIAVVVLTQLHSLATYVAHTHTGERVTLDLRARLLGHSQRLSLGFHDSRGTSDSIYRIQYDAPAVQHMIDSALPFLSSGIMLFVTVYVIARIDWQVALVALGVVPILYVLSRRYVKRVRSNYREIKELETNALSVVQEVLTSVRLVKAFGREDSERERFVHHSDQTARAQVRVSLSEGIFAVLINLAMAAGTALVLVIGIRNVISGVLSLGELLLIFGYLAQLYGPLQNASAKVGDLQSSIASAERVFELLDELPEVEERPDARPLEVASGRIQFRDVTFGYGAGLPVLKDATFSIRPGTRLGIVGRTGAGKSTLVSLVTRFYDPAEGQILLDGVDLRDYKLADLRNQFAIVLQEPVLFSTSVEENIAYGRPGASFEEIVAAAEAAGAHEFIVGLPDGYDTLVGERGMRLSGGERQRITLARAFLKDAPILILDEPTSAVDTKTEADIMQAMERLMAGRTTLMIAHRPSTLDGCDRWLKVSRGTVELLERPPGRAGRADAPKAAVGHG